MKNIYIYIYIYKLPSQLFITGSDPELFASSAINIHHLAVETQLYSMKNRNTRQVSNDSTITAECVYNSRTNNNACTSNKINDMLDFLSQAKKNFPHDKRYMF